MNSTIRARSILGAVALALAGISAAASAGNEVNTGYFGDVAIRGYDPVAYFTLSRPAEGSPEYATEWLGATWYFINDEHRLLFEEKPSAYAPQYGGLCADGVAYGDMTTNIDPSAWRIIEGRLYLNYDPGAAEELETLAGQLDKAEANWPGVRERWMEATD